VAGNEFHILTIFC